MTGIILGEKSDSQQSFNDQGERIPTTFIKTNTCYLVDVKMPEKHGYFAIKLGFGQIKNIKKPTKGELDKAGIKTPLRFLKEFRLEKFSDKINVVDEGGKIGIALGELKIFRGDEIKPAIIFKKGEKVIVSGTSKGKGFQGVVKRHKFSGGPKTHGQSDRERAPGSIGQTTTPGRVYKGKKMAGRMGGGRITIKGLEIMDVREDGLVVKGLVPGAKGGLLEIQSSNFKVQNGKSKDQ